MTSTQNAICSLKMTEFLLLLSMTISLNLILVLKLMTCCVKYYMHIKHSNHSSISHHIHIIIHYYYCGWVMCTLVQYTGRQSQNIEVFHHIHTTYCTLVMSGLLELKKNNKKRSPTRGRTNPWLAL